MRGLIALLLVPMLACYDYKRAVVPRFKNAAADVCFASCKNNSANDEAVVSCVLAWCPGARAGDAGCGGQNPAECVQAGHLNTPATAFAVAGISVLGVLSLYGVLILIGLPRT